MKADHIVVTGNSRDMREVEDGSVHLVVTSPPYWQLKDYGGEQIGFHDSYEEYVNNLNMVWDECYRVLFPGCRLCVNIGDQFARSAHYGRYKVIPIRTEIIKFCEVRGFDYMGAVIWQKVTTTNTTGGGSVMGSFPYPRNGVLNIDYEFILFFKKPGKAPVVEKEKKEESRMTAEEWRRYFSGHWTFSGVRQKDHLAMFPAELPLRLIRMFTFKGETVLDPFLGSGTTSAAARDLGRRSIGYEINPEYRDRIKKKLGPLEDAVYIDGGGSPKERVLPYVFRDPHRIERVGDPESYGSVMDGREGRREIYHKVKEVVDPGMLVLDDGSMIKLIGIKPRPDREEEAVEFLRRITSGKRVYLRYDKALGGGGGSRYCYLHLMDRTHVNAHMIKRGLADVEIGSSYRFRDRFLRYMREREQIDIKS